jgi:glycine/D-amino acid oxidase-like deaminating enzyme
MKIHVIGGGIIGMSTAYQLSKDGHEITVFEKDPAYSESSFARSCGGFRAQYFTPTNVEMSRYSIDFVKNQTDVEFTGNGYLMLFGLDQKADHDYSYKMQREMGASTIKLNNRQMEISHSYINSDDIYSGCITTDGSEGWLDPVSLHKWYKENTDCKFIYADGTKVNHDDAEAVVITAGCWSYKVGKTFGLSIPVLPHKHTVFNVSTSKPVIKDMPLIADLITGIYLRPEGNGYIVGYDGNGTLDSEDLEPDWNSWDEVWEHLYHRFPDYFDEAKMTGAWAGYYDKSAIDNNAIIDHRDKYFFATGFTGRGLMHSPAVGLTLSEMIQNKPLTFDVSSYKINRKPYTEKYVI